ncbi:MAG: hypothetical protein Q9181_002378 [Wetmoreana brouardii]
MSLNGLNATEINEAYQWALGEGGGWFLLKYETRDEVKLLRRGSGGVVDIRETIAQYDEQSPLYGFVHYRRRKVILKYVPEARVIVHFQAITEHFTPHDTVFSFTTPKGLNDVALSSACSLHTASASIKSSSDSLRQRGLSGIAEDASELQSYETDAEPASETRKDSVGASSLKTRPERTDSLPDARTTGALHTPERRESTTPSSKPRNIDKALPPTPSDNTEDKATTRNALEDTLLDSRPSMEGRPSIQSMRPSIRDLQTPYDYKPKIKLGPRPSMDSSGRKNSLDRAHDFRPVSTLPNGVRLPSRKQAPARPKSANGQTPGAEMPQFPIPSPKPVLQAAIPEVSIPLPNTSTKQVQPIENKSHTMTPEKRRLKKALELRQKQIAARNVLETSEREEQPQSPTIQTSPDATKRESLTSALPDISAADDGSADVLQERIDALEGDPDIVHVGLQSLSKGVPESFEVSPISVPDVSDGPSTQASSVSDEDETPTKAEPVYAQEIRGDPLVETTVDALQHPAGIIIPGLDNSQADDQASKSTTTVHDGYKTELPAANDPLDHQSSNLEEGNLPLDAPVSQSKSYENAAVSDEAPIEAPSTSDPPSSLYARRSPIARSIAMSVDVVKPHEIPLPPIDEDEEISLTPWRKAFIERSRPQSGVEGRECLVPSSSQHQEEGEGSKDGRPLSADAPSEQREKRTRRHGLISPIRRISSPDYSDEQFLSDDSFMEELKSATVQEAKPVSVSKSPIMPVFPRSVLDSKSNEQPRSSSASSHHNRSRRHDDQPMMPKLPDLFSARSASAPYAPLHEAQLSPPTLKKTGVSSGISQRIKALEQLSSRPTSPSSQFSSPSAAHGSSAAFPKPRKTSFRASQAAAEIAKASTQASSTRPHIPFSPGVRSPDPYPKPLGDSVVRVDRIDMTTTSGKARPESISVTARIIRGSQNKVPEVPEDPSQPGNMDLYASPLTVEHQSMRPTTPLSPLKPPKPLYARSTSSTSTTLRSDPLSAPRRDSISSRLSSTPSRRGSEPELPHSMSDSSINSMMNFDGTREEKKESRKSRLFKRMSNISAASRRSIASALSPVRKDIKEEPIVEHHEPSRETIRPLAIEIGEVNVQFPDTLLWKRRHMVIDEKGHLVLTASKADNNSKVIPKRYPLTEFNPPYLPDQDQQELPNSVVLDFRDGSTLQCACENSYTRNEVLRALKQAHMKYNT